MPSSTENYYHIHRKQGWIELRINGVKVRRVMFQDITHRRMVIDSWRMSYPPNKNQVREIILIPNWTKWNGFIGDIEKEREC